MKYIFVVLIGTILLLNSCKIQEIKISNPENLKVEELNLKNVKLKMDLPIKNENNFSFTVKKLDLDLYVNGRNVGKLKQTKKIIIKKKCDNVYPVHFEISTKEALNNVLFLYGELQKRNPELNATGTVKVSKFVFSKKIKVNQNQNLIGF